MLSTLNTGIKWWERFCETGNVRIPCHYSQNQFSCKYVRIPRWEYFQSWSSSLLSCFCFVFFYEVKFRGLRVWPIIDFQSSRSRLHDSNMFFKIFLQTKGITVMNINILLQYTLLGFKTLMLGFRLLFHSIFLVQYSLAPLPWNDTHNKNKFWSCVSMQNNCTTPNDWSLIIWSLHLASDWRANLGNQKT